MKRLEFTLKTYPLSFIGKSFLENGDKIVLPQSILNYLNQNDEFNPIIFEIINLDNNKKCHCGVYEFTGDDGCAYIPFWMFKNLGINEGSALYFIQKRLEKGYFLKIQPQQKEFLQISNPKAILELNLRKYTSLTKKNTISIEYNNNIYWLNIVEVKPGNAINIVDTDLNLEICDI